MVLRRVCPQALQLSINLVLSTNSPILAFVWTILSVQQIVQSLPSLFTEIVIDSLFRH